jgi:hypothetical protein
VDASELAEHEKELRQHLPPDQLQRRQSGKREPLETAIARIAALAAEALERSSDSHGWWSDWKEWVERPLPHSESPHPEAAPSTDDPWDIPSTTRFDERWKPLHLADAISTMLRPGGLKPNVLRAGKPAYVACAILAALLRQRPDLPPTPSDVTPEKVMNAIKNYQASVRRKHRR